MKWPWSKPQCSKSPNNCHVSDVPYSQTHEQSNIPILAGVGSITAGLAAAFLGDPTFGMATASVIGAVIGLGGSVHSHVKESQNAIDPDRQSLVAKELHAINQTLRAILFMVIFGVLAYSINTGIDLLAKQFVFVNENPLIVTAIVLSSAYFYITKRSGN